MRRLLPIVLAIVILLALAGWLTLQSPPFWRWGGWELVNLARDRLNGDLKVGSVEGHPFTGFTFRDVTITWSQGDILHTDRLELRFSLWSFFRLQPVIARLALHEPQLTLRQDQEGRWEVANLLKKRPPPPFKSLDFRQILLQQGQLVISRPGAPQRFQNLDLKLALTVLHPKRPNQEIRVPQAELSGSTPLGPFALSTSLTYAHDQLRIDSLDIRRGEQAVASLVGETGLTPPLKGLFSLNVGPLPGSVLHVLWPAWPRNWNAQGKFRLTILSLSHFEITGAGQMQQAAFDLRGTISRETGQWTYDLKAKLTELRSELLEPVNPQWAQKLQGLSPVAADLAFKGTGLAWPPERFDWTLETKAFRDQRVQVEQVKIRFDGNPREQNLQGEAKGNFGEFTLTAAGPLLTSRKGDLKIQTKDFQPARLGLEKAGATALTGQFTGAFSSPEGQGLAGLKLTGDLEARGSLDREPLQDLRARLIWQQAKLEVPKASLRLGPLAADLSGSLAGNQLDWRFQSSLAPRTAKSYLPTANSGPLELNGALSGTLQAPHLVLQGRGAALALDGLALKSFTFKGNAAGWPPATGDLEIRGTGLRTPAGVFSEANLSCRGEGNLWSLHLRAGTPGGDQAEVSGSADLRTRPVSLTLSKFSWRTREYAIANAGPVQLRLLPGLQLAAGTFKVDGGQLALKLEAQGPQLTGQVNVQKFPAKFLSLMGPPLQGSIDGQFAISGTPAAPLLQGQIHWGPGQMGGFNFQALKSTVNYRNGLLYLIGSLEEKPTGPRLVWDGQIPLTLSLIPFKWSLGHENLNLTVKGEKTNLAMLTALAPAVQTAEGSVDIMAQWRGDPHRPQVSGQLRWGEGSLKLRATGLPYHLLPGEAQLQGSKIILPDLTLESGGTLRLSGGLSLAGLTPGQLELRCQVVNFTAIRKEGTHVEANGNLALIGPWNNARLTGQVVVPKATFTTKFFLPGPHPDIVLVNQPTVPESAKMGTANPAFWGNLQIDLTFQSGGEVWIKNRDLQVDLQGSLKALKTPGQDKVAWAGVMRAVQGTINIQDRAFKVTEGTVTLPGKPGAPAILAGRAISEMGEITLFLDISGPANKPALRFSSNPPLPPQDLLSYLVFGRSAATLSREEFNTVNQQALGVFGGITAKKLKDILGSDFPLVCDVSMRCGEQSVGVTKPLTKELSVGFERKSNPLYRDDTNQARIEYKVNKYMSLESTVGRRNTGGDVLFNYDF